MARGSWSRCSRRVFMLAAGRCAAWGDATTNSKAGATRKPREIVSTAIDCRLQVTGSVLAAGRARHVHGSGFSHHTWRQPVRRDPQPACEEPGALPLPLTPEALETEGVVAVRPHYAPKAEQRLPAVAGLTGVTRALRLVGSSERHLDPPRAWSQGPVTAQVIRRSFASCDARLIAGATSTRASAQLRHHIGVDLPGCRRGPVTLHHVAAGAGLFILDSYA